MFESRSCSASSAFDRSPTPPRCPGLRSGRLRTLEAIGPMVRRARPASRNRLRAMAAPMQQPSGEDLSAQVEMAKRGWRRPLLRPAPPRSGWPTRSRRSRPTSRASAPTPSEALEKLRARPRGRAAARARGEGAGVAEAEEPPGRDRGPGRGGGEADRGGREARRRGRGRDRRRAGAGARGGGRLAARAARRDPPRGRTAITPSRRVRRRRRRRRRGRALDGAAGGRARRRASAWSRARRSPRAPASGRRAGSPRRWSRATRPSSHAADTIAAGRGLCRPAAVQVLVEEAPAAVQELLARGVVFDLDHEGGWRSASRAATPARRIVHSGGSQTGHEITSKLAAMVAARGADRGARARPRRRRCGATASAATGVLTDDGPIAAAATVLATGGAAALWRRTTNPRGAIGAGPVLAAAAGADLADLEFCQFHPTALALPGHPLRRRC